MTPEDEALKEGVELIIARSPATLMFTSGAEQLSATVGKSYVRFENSQATDTGDRFTLDEMYVMARTSDVSSWGLRANESVVLVDGEEFQIGHSIKKTPVYWKIYLRLVQ